MSVALNSAPMEGVRTRVMRCTTPFLALMSAVCTGTPLMSSVPLTPAVICGGCDGVKMRLF